MIITGQDVRAWGGLIMMAAGALTLLAFWTAVMAGITVRLWKLASGQAVVRRGRKRARRAAADGERVPLAELLSQPVLPDDTTPIERVSSDG